MDSPDQRRINQLVSSLKGNSESKSQDSQNGYRPHYESPPRSDEEIIEKASAESNGKFDRLFRGDTSEHGNDHSRSDDSFVHKLYPYTQNEEQIYRIHAASGLSRPKSERRPDYLRRSIDRARNNVKWFYEWPEQRLTLKTEPQVEGRSHSHSLGSTGMGNDGNDDLNQSIQALSFSGREKPAPREWIVDNHLWKGHAASWYGEGGVAKSLLALNLGLTVAAKNRCYWMAFTVKTVPVLYLDFELDADEQHRRACELAKGMGLEDIPEDFYYLPVAMMRPSDAFAIAAAECRRLGIELAIVDSVGFALEGDSELARDVLGFYRENIQPLKDAGASPLLIDHQAKILRNEKYSDKQAFGSVYKTNAVRSSFQIRGSHDQGEITATFTHKKNNFGWKEKDFSLKITFGKGLIEVERLPQAEPNPDRDPTKKETVLDAVVELGRATAETVHHKTGIDLKTVQNKFSDLLREGEIVDTGEKQNRSRIVIPHSLTTQGMGMGMKLNPELNLEDSEDGDNSGEVTS